MLVILIETAQVTPPVGFNLYVLQNISGESIGVVARNAFPFFLLMLVMVVILVLFGLLFIFAGSSALAPFIYTLF